MIRGTSISRRLAAAFGALIAVFAVASFFALSGLREIEQGLRQVREQEEGVRLALQLASAVRDQYAHQAHTIIIGDASHLGFYGRSQEHVLALIGSVRRHARHADERGWVDAIERDSLELDAIFRTRIVPAVLEGRSSSVHFEHDHGLMVVSRIQGNVDRLVERFQLSMELFEGQVRSVEAASWRWALVSLGLALLFAVGVGLYIARSVAVPVARLSAGAARIGRGELEARIEESGPDELGALARQFNAMAVAIREHQEQLVQSERLAGIGRLAAGVAHEINNPLGVILGYTRLMKKKAEGALAEDLGVIEAETVRCQEIVEGLLDLARPLKASPEEVDLRALCEEAVQRLREAGGLARTQVVVEGGAAVQGHGPKLRQVLLNLVKNAAEAAGEGGRVRVELAEGAAGTVEVRVGDSGPGLSEPVRARLFEPFFTTKPSGTGLGLAVSQAIAHAHRGAIEPGTSAEGGALFTLRLPREPAARRDG